MKKKDTRHTVIGSRKRAAQRYTMIAYRVTRTDLPKNAGYKGIELRIGKAEFIDWFMPKDFKGCSVDRIESSGHYELSNMQVIEGWRNIAKDKVKLEGGKLWCYRCKTHKELTQMAKSSRRMLLGVTTICKECDNKRRKERSANMTDEQKVKNRERCREYYQRKKAEGDSR